MFGDKYKAYKTLTFPFSPTQKVKCYHAMKNNDADMNFSKLTSRCTQIYSPISHNMASYGIIKIYLTILYSNFFFFFFGHNLQGS